MNPTSFHDNSFPKHNLGHGHGSGVYFIVRYGDVQFVSHLDSTVGDFQKIIHEILNNWCLLKFQTVT